jgi:endonuclease YncB( thermonuclease family)
MIEAALLCLVVGISDGDTLKVRCPDRPPIAVRLAEIDAPEKAQPFGQRSRELLSTLCFRKQAEIRPSSRDRYGRTVARVSCAGADANTAMVRAGLAWAYTRYLTDPQIRAMEVVARRERRGLWADAQPVPPWEWRKAGEKGISVQAPADRPGPGDSTAR